MCPSGDTVQVSTATGESWAGLGFPQPQFPLYVRLRKPYVLWLGIGGFELRAEIVVLLPLPPQEQ
jgi:hypothetical protein